MGHQTQIHMPSHTTKHMEQATTRELGGFSSPTPTGGKTSLNLVLSIMHHLVEKLMYNIDSIFCSLFKQRCNKYLGIYIPMI